MKKVGQDYAAGRIGDLTGPAIGHPPPWYGRGLQNPVFGLTTLPARVMEWFGDYVDPPRAVSLPVPHPPPRREAGTG